MQAIDIALGFPAEERVHTFIVNTPSKDTDMTPIDQLLTRFAQQHLRIDTLETRKSDGLDFHDVAVWGVRAALEAAFNAGVEQGKKQALQQARKATKLERDNG